MSAIPVSLIIVSRHRTASLLRTIAAVRLQDHPALELIVVADPDAALVVRALNLPMKLVEFDEPNISAARNAGIDHAAGDVVAFLDDDAVPEPTWITRIAAPFVNPDVRMATGFVRGRNGISDQWRACDVDQFGRDHALSVDRHAVTLLAGTPTRAVKAQGTNCAARRADVLAIGGFDPNFRYFLEDADISLRLAALGGLTAVVPDAVVQHGYAASIRRRPDRVPLSLHDIGASTACFLRRHAPGCDMKVLCQTIRHAQEARLLQQMVDGRLEPRDLMPLMASFDDGWAEGLARGLTDLSAQPTPDQAFVPFPTMQRHGLLISGRIWQRRELMRRACVGAATGTIVTVICLSPTALFHRHRFGVSGYWMQQGGVFGKSIRDQPLIRLIGFERRVREEAARINGTRPLN